MVLVPKRPERGVLPEVATLAGAGGPVDPVRYAITDLSCTLSDAAPERRLRLEGHLRRWAVDGVEFVQLREKQMEAGALLLLARAAMDVLLESDGMDGRAARGGTRPKLLVNGRLDVAVAAGADGVHLSSQAGTLMPQQVRTVFARAGRAACLVSLSCHTLAEVSAAARGGADLVLFGPVFEKRVGGEVVVPGQGLDQLQEACRAAWPVPVLALGGVSAVETGSCMQAGAAGVAGIRMFS